MKNVNKVIKWMFLIVTLSVSSCLGISETKKPKAKQSVSEQSGSFKLIGTWKIVDVVFEGDIQKMELSQDTNLYQLLGTGWQQSIGKEFTFSSDQHWNSNAFELNKNALTYKYDNSLTLLIKDEDFDFKFDVPILEKSAKKMTWDIGYDVHVYFESSEY